MDPIDRRTVLRGAALLALVPAVVRLVDHVGGGPDDSTGDGDGATAPEPVTPEDRAYAFLDGLALLPSERPGPDLTLPRSYTGGYLGSIGFDVAFTYDCALVVLAYLSRGTPADVTRAVAVGDVLLTLQAADPAGDGRLRNSYIASSALDETGAPRIASHAATSGNQAWAGIALLRLYAATGDGRYLGGAVRLAEFLRDVAHDDRGLPAFAGGIAEGGGELRWRSTEHNTDCTAFLTGLAAATGEGGWSTLAEQARTFVESMWRPEDGWFLVGTLDDGVTPNVHPIAEDAQTWTYLALGGRDGSRSGSLDWARTHLAAQDGPVAGVTVCHVSPTDKVWVEGTAHLALALAVRAGMPEAGPDDLAHADALLDAAWTTQTTGPHADGHGLPAASSDGLDSGFGDLVYASLHTGTTAWALLAARRTNPLAA